MNDVENRFTYYETTREGAARKEDITDKFIELAEDLNRLMPDCREKSIMMTKLEEAKMWATSAISRNLVTR
ncbi:hypothetical protein LCGC14_0616000 [marine sediment metagenome]|uniref:Acb2/Tad1 hairpin domain-containing protein n=1 Tax=marine sediment metagenome TaxID=412755 RepID=A0A0F9TSM0_9ZZZZ